MSEAEHHSALMTEIVLLGGPCELPSTLLLDTAEATKIKIPHRGGYEHFEREMNGQVSARPMVLVYRWTQRTKIAE